MVTVGYFLSSEEHGPAELVEAAARAEQGGFPAAWISDHYVSGFGPKATRLAARIGDGYMSTVPDRQLVALHRASGGRGPVQGGVKVAWAPTEEEGRKNPYRLWANQGLPGELSQVLPTPQHFMQASQLVTEEMIGQSVVAGPDPQRHIHQIQAYVDAGFDEVYVGQIGPDQHGMIDFYIREVLPHIR